MRDLLQRVAPANAPAERMATLRARIQALEFFQTHAMPDLNDYEWFDPFDMTHAEFLLSRYKLRVDAFPTNYVLMH